MGQSLDRGLYCRRLVLGLLIMTPASVRGYFSRVVTSVLGNLIIKIIGCHGRGTPGTNFYQDG